jgi:hypothetical protein
MADSTCVDAQEDLTDDQIQQLLLEAETRLRGSNALSTQNEDAASLRYEKSEYPWARIKLTTSRIPKLSPGSSLEPYVHQGDGVAIVDAAKIADQKQKELSNSLRSVGIKKENTVSFASPFTPPLFPNAMRKIFPTRSA